MTNVNWELRAAKYSLNSPDGIVTKAYVFGAMDPSDENRASIILQNRPDNDGHRLESSEGQSLYVASLSNSMGIRPSDADWFVKDDEGTIRALDLRERQETIPNRTFEAFKNSGEFNQHNVDEERRAFPDEKIWRVECNARPPSEAELKGLQNAFGPEGPIYHEKQHPAKSQEQGAREIDLSKEHFNSQRPDL